MSFFKKLKGKIGKAWEREQVARITGKKEKAIRMAEVKAAGKEAYYKEMKKVAIAKAKAKARRPSTLTQMGQAFKPTMKGTGMGAGMLKPASLVGQPREIPPTLAPSWMQPMTTMPKKKKKMR